MVEPLSSEYSSPSGEDHTACMIPERRVAQIVAVDPSRSRFVVFQAMVIANRARRGVPSPHKRASDDDVRRVRNDFVRDDVAKIPKIAPVDPAAIVRLFQRVDIVCEEAAVDVVFPLVLRRVYRRLAYVEEETRLLQRCAECDERSDPMPLRFRERAFF